MTSRDSTDDEGEVGYDSVPRTSSGILSRSSSPSSFIASASSSSISWGSDDTKRQAALENKQRDSGDDDNAGARNAPVLPGYFDRDNGNDAGEDLDSESEPGIQREPVASSSPVRVFSPELSSGISHSRSLVRTTSSFSSLATDNDEPREPASIGVASPLARSYSNSQTTSSATARRSDANASSVNYSDETFESESAADPLRSPSDSSSAVERTRSSFSSQQQTVHSDTTHTQTHDHENTHSYADDFEDAGTSTYADDFESDYTESASESSDFASSNMSALPDGWEGRHTSLSKLLDAIKLCGVGGGSRQTIESRIALDAERTAAVIAAMSTRVKSAHPGVVDASIGKVTWGSSADRAIAAAETSVRVERSAVERVLCANAICASQRAIDGLSERTEGDAGDVWAARQRPLQDERDHVRGCLRIVLGKLTDERLAAESIF
eukprot:Opistho-2@86182